MTAAQRACCVASPIASPCNTVTPLAISDIVGDTRSVALGTLDTLEAVEPGRQIGIEKRLSWWGGDGLPNGLTTEQDAPDFVRGIRNFQHPDHDTTDWTPATG